MHGPDKASIAEIARVSGLANGTFYIYFKNKDDLIDQLGVSVTEAIVKSVHNPALEHEDAARLVARHIFCFLQIAGSEPNWIPLIVDVLGTTMKPLGNIEAGIRNDVHKGRTSNRFDVPECEEIISIILSLCRIGLERIRIGTEVRIVQQRIIEAGLRMLGISPMEAAIIAEETISLQLWHNFEFPDVTSAR